MEAIVLAGGFGTRLKECLEDIPKPLAPIDGSPFICRILDYLYSNGIHRVIISTGYLAEKIEAAIGNSYRGMTVAYSREDTPLGTGGGIKKALGLCTENEVVVVNGDSFFDVDLFEMKKAHDESGYPLTLAAKHIKNAYRSGLLDFKNGKLCGFIENGVAPSGYINGGIYIIKRTLLESVTDEKFSFENKILASGDYDIGVFESSGYFIDIGIPESYKLAEKNKECLVSKRTRQAVFVNNNEPAFENVITDLKKKNCLVFVVSDKAEDVDILKENINSVLSKNHSLIADGYYYLPSKQAISDEFKKIGITVDFEKVLP